MTYSISKDRLKELLERHRAQSAPSLISPETSTIQDDIQDSLQESLPSPSQNDSTTDRYGNLITYNSAQQAFINYASQGNSCVLIGPAGTGKTTCQKGATLALVQSDRLGFLESDGHKHLISDTPGIVIVAYTRRAVANIRKNLSKDLQSNCLTIHKLLEYQPVYYETEDPETGDTKTKMCFEPTRNALKPLPSSIKCIIYEESSMLGTDLYQEVQAACPHKPQEIFLGDIQQLPPVFGSAILGFKLLELKVFELTEVYRQALESPIISLAHRILSGNPIPASEYPSWHFKNKLKLHPWKKKLEAQIALNTAVQFFTAAADHKSYDPEEDIILIPFNKSFGTDELNKFIANHLSKKRGAVVHQVVAGFMRHYFSVGDKVLYEKEDAVIIDIQPNPSYSGAPYLPASPTLDYHGYDPESGKTQETQVDDDVDFILLQASSSESKEDRTQQSSHILTLQMSDSDTEVKIDRASEINSLLLGYALTVHKAQGSEWRKVFCVFHQSHAVMLQRELLYTAITRAKEELYILCEPETFTNGILSQKVKGNTLEEKAEFFKGKKEKEKRLC